MSYSCVLPGESVVARESLYLSLSEGELWSCSCVLPGESVVARESPYLSLSEGELWSCSAVLLPRAIVWLGGASSSSGSVLQSYCLELYSGWEECVGVAATSALPSPIGLL